MSVLGDSQVSFDDELLILVDGEDNITGYESKRNAHRGSGLLHRAFSIFIVSTPDRLLVHKRSAKKPLWPLFWTNSCCSHPRKGESYRAAAHRRLQEELGISTDLEMLYQFEYSATFRDKGSERELCAVFMGRVDPDCDVRVNSNEIAEWRWVSCTELDAWVSSEPGQFTPWFLLEWARRRNPQWGGVERPDARRTASIWPGLGPGERPLSRTHLTPR